MSKITMYHFYHQQIVAKFGKNEKLASTDTDSLVYLIEANNLCDDMAINIDAFDTSVYPTTHPLHS